MRAVENSTRGPEHAIREAGVESAYHEEGEEQKEEQPYIDPPDTESMKEPLKSR